MTNFVDNVTPITATWLNQVDALLQSTVGIASFGAVGNGTTDDTGAIQSAINSLSQAGGGTLKFSPGCVYNVKGLTPKSNVYIDLNGSTIKLANNAKVPIFFDGGSGNGSNFGVGNGILDCNQAGGNSGINVVGGIWLTGWYGLSFPSLTIQNCYRIGLNLINCSMGTIRNYQFLNSGNDDGLGYYAYALNIDGSSGTSRYFIVENMVVANTVGYGIHFYSVFDFSARNLSFTNLNYKTQSEAITFTTCSRFSTDNIAVNQVSGDAIEVNSCNDGSFNNYNVNQAGNRALLIGLNTAGPDSLRLRFNNYMASATIGTYAASISYLEGCEFNELNLDKPVSYNTASIGSKNNIIRNSDIASTASGSIGLINKGYFNFENVRFTDWVFRRLDRQRATIGSKQRIVAGTSFNVPFLTILPGLLTNDGIAGGTLTTITRFIGSYSQGTFQECNFLVSDAGATTVLSAITQLNNAVARAITIAPDSVNRQIVLTNPSASGSGIDLDVSINIDVKTFL